MITQRRLLGLLGLLAIIGSIMYISWPVGHIPPYDANFVRLAESPLQGYCSGATLMKTGGGPNASMTADCRKKLAKDYSNKPNLSKVLPDFCQAVIDSGWPGSKAQCLGIMVDNQYWPTYDGTISDQWNRARPYPSSFLNTGGSSSNAGSRTGGHNGSSRNNTPQHTVPSYP